MATRMNRRRLVVNAAAQFENAEGVIPLVFPRPRTEDSYVLHKLVDGEQTNSRNDLAQAKFTILNTRNGDTIGVMAQCALRDEVLKGFALKEKGVNVPVKFVSGNRAKKNFLNGMTNIFATNIELDIPAETAETIASMPPATLEASQPTTSSVQ